MTGSDKRPNADPHAFAALCAVSAAAAHALNVDQAATDTLSALIHSGVVAGGAIIVYSHTPLRYVQGPIPFRETLLEGLEQQTAPLPLLLLPSNIHERPIPTRAAPSSFLYLLRETPLDSTFVNAVAEQIALSLDRAYLNEQALELYEQADRRIKEVFTIYEIGQAIDSVEIGQLLEIITEKAARLIEAQACSLMRLNPATNTLTIAASYGLSEEVVIMTQRALGEGIAGKVAQTGESMLIGDAVNDPRLSGVRLRPDIGASMVVPMKADEGHVIGVLSIRRRQPAPAFTLNDLRLFSVFASQAALAITNKQLYDDLKRHAKELSTLSDLTQAIISNLELPNLLANVCENIVEVVRFDRCCIYLLERSIRRFVPYSLLGYRSDVIGRNPVKIGEGVVGIVARKQMPIVVADARQALQPMRGFARSLGTNAFAAIPIVYKSQTIGVVVADNKISGRPILDQHVELLTTFVNQAGIAIYNAQLYEDWQLRYQEVNRLATQTENILRSIAMMVAVVDQTGLVTRWNAASEKMWGITEKEAREKPFSALVERFELPVEEADYLRRIMDQARETGNPFHEYKVALHVRGHSEIYVNVLLSPLIDRQGERQGVILILEDVTRLHKMESEIGRIRRLADIGQLAAKMAHEVRNPLSSIKGAAQLMRNEYEDMAPFREFLDIIIDEVNHLSKITTDLLDFARPMLLDLHWTNVNLLAERTLHFMAHLLAEAEVRVEFHPVEDLPLIHADPKQIEQVMRNIVINAVQAMPQGGTLTACTEYDPAAATVMIRFEDTGVGIPSGKVEEIFQPFVTTKTKGSGLGLSIVHRIVEKHGGRVEVKSRPGAGTSFAILLPIQPSENELTETARTLDTPAITSALPDL